MMDFASALNVCLIVVVFFACLCATGLALSWPVWKVLDLLGKYLNEEVEKDERR